MEDDSKPEQSSWTHLPDVCLRHVFHWLDDRDRSQAALVCKKWNWVMYSGSLWRSRTISFYGRPSRAHTLELKSALWHTKKFSKYLKHLEIKLLNPYNTNITKRFQGTIKDLLSHLGNSRLVSLSIEHLRLNCLIWNNAVKAQFINNLATFLKRSKQLDYLNLKGARVTLEEGCKLLNSLSCSISKLNIEDFFSIHSAAYSSTLFHQTMSKFHSIAILTFNYSCISNELLDTLREHSAHSLCTLNIKCHIHDPHGHEVCGTSWTNLAKRAPKLIVNYVFQRVMKHNDLARILLAEIPVRSISLRSCYYSDPEWIMRPTLTNLLPAYRHVLQELTLELNNYRELMDDELIQLILSCKRLLFLKVWAFLSVTFMERLLQNRAERKCILTTIKVRIYTTRQETSEEDQLLDNIYKKFKCLIDSELNYFVTTNTMV
ncbi:PREDICTED: F-box only protein 39 [Eurypyga helias]|uniref:F-box only protein 39 n=1 Tax=Eurypyga helias TaxID=54383 RepID=UPI0005280A96|nr:PREDICTED: F-box only protein 39 [Eurypyga helias]KFV91667.1 F-box only protein 39 [Eurypyga helias]